MNCIRCGVAVTPQGNIFAATDGVISCPNSLPGEAAVHRVAARLPGKPKRGMNPFAQAVIGYTAGRVVGNLLLRSTPPVPPVPTPYNPNQGLVDQTAQYLQSRQ